MTEKEILTEIIENANAEELKRIKEAVLSVTSCRESKEQHELLHLTSD